jgi:hypothetical protein
LDANFYGALQDEVQRLNKAIHNGLSPTIYRAGTTYIIEYAEIEANRIWFSVIRLEWNYINKHFYIPYVEEREFYCFGQWEWAHILCQSGIKRNPYFTLRQR